MKRFLAALTVVMASVFGGASLASHGGLNHTQMHSHQIAGDTNPPWVDVPIT